VTPSKILSKLSDNRLTRPQKQWIVRSLAAKRVLRTMLNRWYTTFDETEKSLFYDRYAKIFRGSKTSVEPGEWTITFAGREVRLPLRPSFSWLDWDNAVSILGHDVEIKQTYAALLASDQRPVLFMDVGANYGTHSILFLAAGVPVIAFEPNTSCYPCFRTVCQLNGLSGRWEPVAVSSRPGSIQLVYPEKETWLGSISEEIASRLKDRNGVVEQRVPVKTLDDYLNDIPPGVVILKIDAEGSELEVLRGASQVLDICKPRIVIESRETKTRRDLCQLLERFGYDVHSLPWAPSSPARPLGIDEFIASPGNNFIAIPRDGAAKPIKLAE
jgi:FkbM family methyltransferase